MPRNPVLCQVEMAIEGGDIVGGPAAYKVIINVLITAGSKGMQVLCTDEGGIILIEIHIGGNGDICLLYTSRCV